MGFEDEETPSGVVRRGRPPANYRSELTPWFGGATAEAPVRMLKALGTTDPAPLPVKERPEGAGPGRIPFLIF